MSDDPKPKRIQKDDYHIEHILPQQPGSSSLDFKDKKKIYMGEEIRSRKTKTSNVMTCYDMTKNDVCRYTEWTPKSLEKRKEELIGIIESALEL